MCCSCFRFAAAIFLLGICYPDPSQAQEASNPRMMVAADSASIRLTPKKKNPTGAMLRSLVVPGWGQFYNGKYWKAALAFGAETGLIATAIYWNQQAVQAPPNSNDRLFYRNNRNTAVWFLAGTILLSMLDAYVDAQLSDFDESPDLSIAAPVPPNRSAGGILLQFKIKL